MPSLSLEGDPHGASYVHHKELQEDFLEEGAPWGCRGEQGKNSCSGKGEPKGKMENRVKTSYITLEKNSESIVRSRNNFAEARGLT